MFISFRVVEMHTVVTLRVSCMPTLLHGPGCNFKDKNG